MGYSSVNALAEYISINCRNSVKIGNDTGNRFNYSFKKNANIVTAFSYILAATKTSGQRLSIQYDDDRPETPTSLCYGPICREIIFMGLN